MAIVGALCAGVFDAEPASLAAANEGGNAQALGRVLFTRYTFAFETAGVLLVVVAVGASGRSGSGRGHAGSEPGPDAYSSPCSAMLFAHRRGRGADPAQRHRGLHVVELMLNAVNLPFITFAKTNGALDGQVLAFFVMEVAASRGGGRPRHPRRHLPQALVDLGRRRQPAQGDLS